MQHTKQRTFKNLGTEGRRRRKNNKFLSHSAIFLAHCEICIQEISLSCEPQNLKKNKQRETASKSPPHSNNNLHTGVWKIKNPVHVEALWSQWISISQPDQLISSGTSALRLFRGHRNSRQLITKPLAVWLA